MLQSDTTGVLQRLLKYPPIEDIKEIVAMGLSFHTYVLGGCASSKPSIIPGSIKAFNVKPVALSKSKEIPVEPPSPTKHAAKDPLLPVSTAVFDPLLTPSVGLKLAAAKTPVKVESPLPIPVEVTPVAVSLQAEEHREAPKSESDSPSNSVLEPNESYSKEALKEDVLSGLDNTIQCLEEQVRLKAFNEVNMMRALGMLEKVRDIILRDLLSRK